MEDNEKSYYELLCKIQDNQRKGNYYEMLDCCEKSLPLLSDLVRDTVKQYGIWDINSIPAIEIGCRFWSALNNIEALEKVKTTINQIPKIQKDWGDFVESSFDDANFSILLQKFIGDNAGIKQNCLSKYLNIPGRDISRIINTLEKLSIIKRIKDNKTYLLYFNMQ